MENILANGLAHEYGEGVRVANDKPGRRYKQADYYLGSVFASTNTLDTKPDFIS